MNKKIAEVQSSTVAENGEASISRKRVVHGDGEIVYFDEAKTLEEGQREEKEKWRCEDA